MPFIGAKNLHFFCFDADKLYILGFQVNQPCCHPESL